MKALGAVLRAVGAERPYTRTRPLAIEEIEVGAPRAGELLLRVEACGVCHSDISVVDGSRVRPLPMVLGHEAAGVVEEVGPGVHDVRRGDRVVLAFVPSCGHCVECAGSRPGLCVPGAAANGRGELLHGPSLLHDRQGSTLFHHLGVSGFAQYAVVARESAVVIPPDVPMETAALFGCAVLTGVGAVVNSARVQPGQTVAVFGLGGVGLAAVMGAALADAARIIAVDPAPEKRELARALGASEALAPAEAGEVLKRGGGVDIAIEAAGATAALEAAFAALARGGTAVTVGLPHPAKTATFQALAFAGEGKSLIGSYMGAGAPARAIPRYLALWRAGRLPVEKLRSAVLPLASINEAFERLADGSTVRQVILPHAAVPVT